MELSKDLMLTCSEHLSGYKSACEDHPDLKAFDSSLQQRTNKMINSLTIDAKTGTVSQHAVHMEVTNHLLGVTQGVAKFIVENKADVYENKALKSLIDAYFKSIDKTLEIFNTIENCVEKAEIGQLLILQAVAEFDKESAEKGVGGKSKKYEKTLKELKKFKAMGDPFSGQVITSQFELIQKQQETLLKEVIVTKKNLEAD